MEVEVEVEHHETSRSRIGSTVPRQRVRVNRVAVGPSRENVVATNRCILQINVVRKYSKFIGISILGLSLIVAGFAFWGRVEKPEGRYVDGETGNEMIFRRTGFLTTITSGDQVIYKWEMKSLPDIQEWMEQARVSRLDDLKNVVGIRDKLLKLREEALVLSPDEPLVDGSQDVIEAGNESERKLAEFSELSGEEFFFPDPKLKRRKVIVFGEEGLVGWHFVGTAVIEGDTLIITSTGQRFEKAK